MTHPKEERARRGGGEKEVGMAVGLGALLMSHIWTSHAERAYVWSVESGAQRTIGAGSSRHRLPVLSELDCHVANGEAKTACCGVTAHDEIETHPLLPVLGGRAGGTTWSRVRAGRDTSGGGGHGFNPKPTEEHKRLPDTI